MGFLDYFDQRFPAWFDEGLASYLSGDDRFPQYYSDADRQWIRGARTFRDWRKFIQERNDWRPAYGAAAANVRLLDQQLGRDGLQILVDRVASGEDFTGVLAALKAHRTDQTPQSPE
jgi:hypothetical protein